MSTLTEYKPGTLTHRGNPKIESVEDEHHYSIVCTKEKLSMTRVLAEVPNPENTPFVLVEQYTRQINRNTPVSWTLFVHKNFLNHPSLSPRSKDGKKHSIEFAGNVLGPHWGSRTLGNGSFLDYRYVTFAGKFPKQLKQDIARLRRMVEGIPVDTLAEVSYL